MCVTSKLSTTDYICTPYGKEFGVFHLLQLTYVYRGFLQYISLNSSATEESPPTPLFPYYVLSFLGEFAQSDQHPLLWHQRLVVIEHIYFLNVLDFPLARNVHEGTSYAVLQVTAHAIGVGLGCAPISLLCVCVPLHSNIFPVGLPYRDLAVIAFNRGTL